MQVKLVNENFKGDWVRQLLISRGVKEKDLDILVNPTKDCLLGPELLQNIDAAATTIIEAVTQKCHFGLLVDCDVDGITSATIIYHYLMKMDPDIKITYFFHDRKSHGLEDSYNKFIEAQVDIIIQPDSGINDKQYHDLLGECGIQTIVLDHHEYEDVGFSEYAIYVDNQISPNYTNKALAGCGITWQCCRRIDAILGRSDAFKYIDLVALGCAADVMSPLTLENRFIFQYGFSHIQDPAFLALCDKQSYSMKGIVNYTSVAFYIAPLINACMRTGTAEEKLLMYKSFLHPDRSISSGKRGAKGETVSILEECCRVLTNVKARQQRMIDKYMSIFEGRIAEYSLNDSNIIVLRLTDEDKFDSELNGLIAMKISGRYHKPCLVLRDGPDGLSKGSARNPNGSPISDLKSFYSECPYVEWSFGHANAHGSAIKTKNFDDFIDWFNTQTKDFAFNENCYEVNYLVTPSDGYLSDLCWDIAENEELWGGDNPQPVIGLRNYHIRSSSMQVMGTKKDTIKFILNGVTCIIFRSAELALQLRSMADEIIINAVGRPSINEWCGNTNIQLILDDIEIKEDNILEF